VLKQKNLTIGEGLYTGLRRAIVVTCEP